MEISTAYQKNISFLKELKPTAARAEIQAEVSDSFEDIYKKAVDSDIKLDNSKKFLSNLSSDELQVLQKHSSLASPINVARLSNEGAYNLLMHDYEKFDFNNDGLVQDGEANTGPVIPKGMSDDVKEAYIQTLNSLNDEDRLNAMSLTIDLNIFNSQQNNTAYEPTKIDYDYIKIMVDNIIHPLPMATSSDELKDSMKRFWSLFMNNYESNNKA